MTFEGRIFRSVSNSSSGDVDAETLFHYHQIGEDLVWATYEGGSVRFGTLVARVLADASLDMRYQHVNRSGELMTGVCRSRPEVLPDGRLRLHESWRWTCGDRSAGRSVVEEVMEVPDESAT